MKSNQVQPRVLSIQSHVVSGYCGNKSATFPLQLLGFEVDPINTVQFSNHNQYQACLGQVITDKDLEVLVEGLSMNGLDNGYTHILTGFINSPDFIRALAKVIRKFKQQNSDCIYVCDPVLGDDGKLYVPESIAKPLKDFIIPLADVIVPNQFEAEYLTGVTIKSLDTAIEAMNIFHAWGVKIVVISSAIFENEDNLVVLASRKGVNNDDQDPCVLKVEVTKQRGSYVGTGDLFAALITGWLFRSDNDMVVTLERTVSTLQHVISRTLEMAQEESPRGYELKLIQSKVEIESPHVVAKVMKI